MLNNFPNHSYILFIDKDPLPSSIPDTIMSLKMWLTTFIVHRQNFPVGFIHAYEKNIIDKEKTEASLLPLTNFIWNYFVNNPYPKDRYFQKIYLEIALAKEQENGNFLNIKKLPGSRYYFASKKEELYSPVLQGFGILIINNIKIEGYPKDTRIFIDPHPEPKAFHTAKNILLKELRGLFEQAYNLTLEKREIEDSSEEEKDLLFQAWVYDMFAGSDMIKKYEALLL